MYFEWIFLIAIGDKYQQHISAQLLNEYIVI